MTWLIYVSMILFIVSQQCRLTLNTFLPCSLLGTVTVKVSHCCVCNITLLLHIYIVEWTGAILTDAQNMILWRTDGH